MLCLPDHYIFMVDFTEKMRALRYRRIISLESFRTSNFELMADILYWMVQRYDPEISIHNGIETEDNRVDFIIEIVKQLETKAKIYLDARNLYAADGFAVKELLKLANILFPALYMVDKEPGRNQIYNSSSINVKTTDINNVRALASDTMENGAKFYILLQKEILSKDSRAIGIDYLEKVAGKLDGTPEDVKIEKVLLSLVKEKKKYSQKIEQQNRLLESDKRELIDKVQKKSLDLDLNQRRLESLKHVKPSFMEEYELLEVELQTIYETYSVRFRNVHYLKKEIEILQKKEKERIQASERSMKRIQLELHEEELKILRGDDDSFSIETEQSGKIISKDEEDSFLAKQGNAFMSNQVNTHILGNQKSKIEPESDYSFDLVKQNKKSLSRSIIDCDDDLQIDCNTCSDQSYNPDRPRQTSVSDESQTILSSKVSLADGDPSNNHDDETTLTGEDSELRSNDLIFENDDGDDFF